MGKWHEKQWECEMRRSWWLGPSSSGNRFRPPVLPVKASSVRFRSSDVSPESEEEKAPGSCLAVQINREEVLTHVTLTPSHMYTHMTFNRRCTHNYTLRGGCTCGCAQHLHTFWGKLREGLVLVDVLGMRSWRWWGGVLDSTALWIR